MARHDYNVYRSLTGSTFNVSVSYNPAANWTLAIISLTLHVALAIWQIHRVVKHRRNVFKDEIWSGTKYNTMG